MAIDVTDSKLHWNYFLALETDLETLSRYIEFHKDNFNVFSIELAHLLFAAASEVDVLAKRICEILDPAADRENINHYRAIIVPRIPDLSALQVFVPRYGLTLTPWDNWATGTNPNWWRSYNNVKHQRDQHFDEATLKNAVNALGALLIMNFHYYRLADLTPAKQMHPSETTRELKPESTLLRLPRTHYDLSRMDPYARA